MTLSRSASLYQPSKPYLDSLDALHRRDDADQLRQGLGQIVKRAGQTRDLAQRNRLWFDAVHLWRRDWHRELRPGLLDAHAIAATRALLDQADDVPDDLRSLTDEVLLEVWPDFDAFKNSEAGQREVDFETENWLGDYHAWLDRYLPCLLMGLSEDVEAAESQVGERIDWMVSKVAAQGHDLLGYRDGLLDKCWAYARAHWSAAEPADGSA